MSDRAFVDTNVLVYVFDHDEPEKQAVARRILRTLGETGSLVVGTQVLQEFYVTVTRKLARPLSAAQAELAVRGFAKFPVQRIDTPMVLDAIRRSRATNYSLWDTLIIEAALASGCRRLVSEGMQAGHDIDGLSIENPF